jgi:hypothetical protein
LNLPRGQSQGVHRQNLVVKPPELRGNFVSHGVWEQSAAQTFLPGPGDFDARRPVVASRHFDAFPVEKAILAPSGSIAVYTKFVTGPLLGEGVLCVNGGRDEESIWKYIREQEAEDKRLDQMVNGLCGLDMASSSNETENKCTIRARCQAIQEN